MGVATLVTFTTAAPSEATAAATASAAQYSVVGLGDSVESGYHCDCTSFVTTAATTLADAQGKTAVVANDAVAGATTPDVLDQLQQAGVRSAISTSDLVVIEIGANDFDSSLATDSDCSTSPASTCYAADAASVTTNLTKIVNEVKALQIDPSAQVVVMGYWNVFTDGAVAEAQGQTYVNTSDALTSWFNSMAEGVASQAGVLYADAASPFAASGDVTAYLAADGDHPNAAGHTLLERAVVATVDTAPTAA